MDCLIFTTLTTSVSLNSVVVNSNGEIPSSTTSDKLSVPSVGVPVRANRSLVDGIVILSMLCPSVLLELTVPTLRKESKLVAGLS